MVDQKDCLQMIGRWGYTPTTLRAYLRREIGQAMDCTDHNGANALWQIMTLCNFAETGDYVKAVAERPGEIASDAPSEINDMYEAILRITAAKVYNGTFEEYCQVVVGGLYEVASSVQEFPEALRHMRQKIMCASPELSLRAALASGESTSESVLGIVLRLAYIDYQRQEGEIMDSFINPLGLRALDDITDLVLSHKDVLLGMPARISPDFEPLRAALVEIFFGGTRDLRAACEVVNRPIKELMRLLPHEMREYELSLSLVLSAFFVALALGEISYSDFKRVLSVSDRMKEAMELVDVERIQSMRTN